MIYSLLETSLGNKHPSGGAGLSVVELPRSWNSSNFCSLFHPFLLTPRLVLKLRLHLELNQAYHLNSFLSMPVKFFPDSSVIQCHTTIPSPNLSPGIGPLVPSDEPSRQSAALPSSFASLLGRRKSSCLQPPIPEIAYFPCVGYLIHLVHTKRHFGQAFRYYQLQIQNY